MRLGFIGIGSMGSMLVKSLIRSGAVEAEDVTAANRTIEKVTQLAEAFPGLRIAEHNRDAVVDSEVMFVCVKPHEYKQVIEQIRPVARKDQILVSITSPVLIKHLEEQLPCKIAKVIPSITNSALSGASLCVYSERLNKEDRIRLEQLFGAISEPIQIPEPLTRAASDLSSCGPAFLSFFLQRFIDAAVAVAGMPRDLATRLSSEMLTGTGKLLTEEGFTPESLQQRVCVPGGITAEGLKMLEAELSDVFHELIRTTHKKYDDDVVKVESMLYGSRLDEESVR